MFSSIIYLLFPKIEKRAEVARLRATRGSVKARPGGVGVAQRVLYPEREPERRERERGGGRERWGRVGGEREVQIKRQTPTLQGPWRAGISERAGSKKQKSVGLCGRGAGSWARTL